MALTTMGLQFVIRNKEGTSWFRDEKNGNSTTLTTPPPSTKAADELLETIIRRGWQRLVDSNAPLQPRVHHARAECAPGASEKSIAKAVAAAAKIMSGSGTPPTASSRGSATTT